MTVIKSHGWVESSCWDNSKLIEELYKNRCKKVVEEMTSHKQAASFLINQSHANIRLYLVL